MASTGHNFSEDTLDTLKQAVQHRIVEGSDKGCISVFNISDTTDQIILENDGDITEKSSTMYQRNFQLTTDGFVKWNEYFQSDNGQDISDLIDELD